MKKFQRYSFALAFTSVFTLVSSQALALSNQEAANNLLFIMTGIHEGTQCQSLGVNTGAALKAWEKSTGAILLKSMNAIEEHSMQKKGLNKQQARDVSLGFVAQINRMDAQRFGNTRNSKNCTVYESNLNYYRSQLKA